MNSSIPQNAENSVQPSFAMRLFTAGMSADQSRPSVRPNHGLRHPPGTNWFSTSGLTSRMTRMPTEMLAIVMIVNCSTSVKTTLNIPPFAT